MTDTSKKIQDLIETLKRERDELALKMHLGKMEAREEWEKVEARLEKLKSDAAPYTEVVGDTAKNLGAVLETAGEEIRRGYDKIRALLRKEDA